MSWESTQISKRLSICGPDTDGYYELTIEGIGGSDASYHFISRSEADALIRALTAPTVNETAKEPR